MAIEDPTPKPQLTVRVLSVALKLTNSVAITPEVVIGKVAELLPAVMGTLEGT